jgi:HAMP domain-containing protein
VTSARQRDANRRNARSSTGPRTSAGKARAAQNARRHGLSLPTRYDPSRRDEVEALARAIAGADVDAECLELAHRIAEAQIDIIRARSARWQLFPEALRERDGIVRLAATDRYERRAWLRRKRAIRELDDARSVESAGDAAWHLAERSQLRQA